MNSKIMYRSIMLLEQFQYLNFESAEGISCFSRFFGAMSVVGLRRRIPKANTEHECRVNDGVNMTSRIEVSVNANSLILRTHAFLHIVGNPVHNNDWLQQQLSTHRPAVIITPQLRVNSKFDFNNNTYKVIDASDQGVRVLSIWGDQKGEELLFGDVNEVVELVAAKRR